MPVTHYGSDFVLAPGTRQASHSFELKRLLILVISVVVYLGDRVGMLLMRAGVVKRGSRLSVLYYHSVPSAERMQFARQMDDLLRYTAPMAWGKIVSVAEGRNYVAVTFDDGFANVVENALPELERRGIPCTIFAVSERLGKSADWKIMGNASHANEEIMSAEQIVEVRSELVEIGSHSLTHPVLTTVDHGFAWNEIFESRVKLENLVGRKVRFFSFPYGAYNEDLIAICRAAGYEQVFTTLSGITASNGFVVGRTPAKPTDWKWEFRLKLLGAYRWLGIASLVKKEMLTVAKALEARVGRIARILWSAGRHSSAGLRLR
jgi:peptidoglycan/xylan/chitin deacetylase (PgdA/CDA1 family)